MPEIKIHEDPILQVAEIMSVMAHPGDELKRYELERKIALNLFLAEKEELLSGCSGDEGYIQYISELCDELSIELAPMLLDSDSYESSLKKAFPAVALLIGKNVEQMRIFNEIDNAYVGRNRASQYIVDKLANTGLKVSNKTIGAAWSKYKPVSHLWAAYVFFCTDVENTVGTGTDLFLYNYKEILYLAAIYQEFLTNYKSNNNRKIEFDLEQVWQVPQNLKPANFELIYGCTEDHESLIIEWNKEYFVKSK